MPFWYPSQVCCLRSFFLTVGASLLTVHLGLKHAFSIVNKEAPIVSRKAQIVSKKAPKNREQRSSTQAVVGEDCILYVVFSSARMFRVGLHKVFGQTARGATSCVEICALSCRPETEITKQREETMKL